MFFTHSGDFGHSIQIFPQMSVKIFFHLRYLFVLVYNDQFTPIQPPNFHTLHRKLYLSRVNNFRSYSFHECNQGGLEFIIYHDSRAHQTGSWIVK